MKDQDEFPRRKCAVDCIVKPAVSFDTRNVMELVLLLNLILNKNQIRHANSKLLHECMQLY